MHCIVGNFCGVQIFVDSWVFLATKLLNFNYYIVGKVGRGEFDELSMICQAKLVLIINNLLDDLLVQTFFHQMLEKSQFAKLSHYTVYN